MQARHEKRAAGMHVCRVPDQSKEVGTHHDTIAGCGAQVFDQGAAVDVVIDPGAFLLVAHLHPVADPVLDLEEALQVPVFVHGKEMYGQPVDGLRAGRPVVLPGEVIPGAGGEHVHLAAGAGRPAGQVGQQGLRPAHRSLPGPPGADERDALGPCHADRSASCFSSRARRVSSSRILRPFFRSIPSTAATRSPLTWFCCDQRR